MWYFCLNAVPKWSVRPRLWPLVPIWINNYTVSRKSDTINILRQRPQTYTELNIAADCVRKPRLVFQAAMLCRTSHTSDTAFSIICRVVGFLWCLWCCKLWVLGLASAATPVVEGGAYRNQWRLAMCRNSERWRAEWMWNTTESILKHPEKIRRKLWNPHVCPKTNSNFSRSVLQL